MSDRDDNDLEWVPPTEAELKVINARRERSNKISKLMGDYLLKGYKMLATTCDDCGTIELEDKQGRKYCIACEEVDCEENSKDNPAVNARAARNQLAEGQLQDLESQIIEQEPQIQERRIPDRNADPSLFMHTPPNSLPLRIPATRNLHTNNGGRSISLNTTHSQPLPLINAGMDAVYAKLASATEALAATDDIETSKQLVNLIKDCADCVQSLKGAANSATQ